LLGQAALPDSIRSALRKHSDKPLRQFQNNLIQQLQDTNIVLANKEKLVNELLEQAISHKNQEIRSKYGYTAGLVYQNILDNGAMALYAYETSFKAAEQINDRAAM